MAKRSDVKAREALYKALDAAKKPALTPKPTDTDDEMIEGLRRKIARGAASANDMRMFERLMRDKKGGRGYRWEESKIIAEFLNVEERYVRGLHKYGNTEGFFDSWNIIHLFAKERGAANEEKSKEQIDKEYKLVQTEHVRVMTAIKKREYIPAAEIDCNMREIVNYLTSALKEIINSAPSAVCEKLNISFDNEEIIRSALDTFARTKLKQMEDKMKQLEDRLSKQDEPAAEEKKEGEEIGENV
jgi:BMFP domain-containing protein YqiC